MTLVMLADAKGYVALSQVMRVEEAQGDLLRLTLVDGSRCETYKHQWAFVTDNQFQQIVPAAPGTLLICNNEHDVYDPEFFEPVVAWGVMASGSLKPLTHYGVPDEFDPHVVHPDGKVTNSGGGVYKSLDEYLPLLAQRDAEAQAA